MKPKNYTYKKKKLDFLLFLASSALGRDPPPWPRRPSQTVVSPTHASLKFSLILSIFLCLSFFLSRSLSNLSLGWDEKKRRTRKKKQRAGEKLRKRKEEKKIENF